MNTRHHTPLLLTLLVACLAGFTATPTSAAADSKEVRFTSVPDIFNWNIDYPTPG